MQIETLDHVALWGRPRPARRLSRRARRMHVVDRTERFTPRLGRPAQLTLFAADAPRPRCSPASAAVFDLDEALAALPDAAVQRWTDASSSTPAKAPAGLRRGRRGRRPRPRPRRPSASRPRRDLRAARRARVRVENGSSAPADWILLEQGDPGESERPLLNHLGLRVESAEEHIEEAERRGLEIADVVDAENTYAVFVWGPDRIKLEYVEHKPTLALT